MSDFNDGIEKALQSPQDMDAYLEVRSAQEVIDDIRTLKRPTPDRSEARERIALLLLKRSRFGDGAIDICRELNSSAWVKAIETADAILATGLVQDEASIRADEREKCAHIFEVRQHEKG